MRPGFSRAMLRDAVVVAAVAVVTVQGLRRWVGDRYLVPTGSMEPLLHGDPLHGDVVFVGKCASASGCALGDLVVVRSPGEPEQQLVKRIAACGDDPLCWIDIRQGDVWLGADSQRLERVVKDPLGSRGQRVTWGAVPGSEASRTAVELAGARLAEDGTTWQLAPSPLTVAEARSQLSAVARAMRHRAGRTLPEGCLGSARPVDAGFVDATGARGQVGDDVPVHDVGLELDLAPSPGNAPAPDVLATVETRFEALTFHWQPATGRVVLWRDGADVATATLPPIARPSSLELGLLDDRAFLCVDGRADALFTVARRPDWNGDRSAPPPGPRSLVWVRPIDTAGAANVGSALAWTRVRVFHDVYAWRDPIAGLRGQPGEWPRQVPPGHWFLLGDSPFDSRDSRHFGPVSKADFLGLPWCVLGPWPRARWVRP